MGDFGLSEPIAVLDGDKLANDSDINWDGQTDVDYQFEVGEQLMFRLKELWFCMFFLALNKALKLVAFHKNQLSSFDRGLSMVFYG